MAHSRGPQISGCISIAAHLKIEGHRDAPWKVPFPRRPEMSLPVVAEFWTTFEAILSVQAKKLVEDIAKHQRADPKELWAKVRPQIKIKLVDIEIPDELPTQCPHLATTSEGAIRARCRAPCLLGAATCPQHIQQTLQSPAADRVQVRRVIDWHGVAYFVDPDGVARDRNGCARGCVEDDTLMLFEEV